MDEQPISATSDASPIPDSDSLPYATPHSSAVPGEGITRGDAACLAIKIIGFFEIVQALPGIAAVLTYFNYGGSYLYGSLIRYGMNAAVGVFLVVKGEAIARWLLPRTAIVVPEPPGPVLERIQSMAFSVLGLLIFVESFPIFAWALASLVFGDGRGAIQRTPLAVTTASLPVLMQHGIATALGMWLFFGSKRMAVWWSSLRRPDYGSDEAADQSSQP